MAVPLREVARSLLIGALTGAISLWIRVELDAGPYDPPVMVAQYAQTQMP